MDDAQLRAAAATRPGYATYPDTRPGNPSWWRRPLPDGPTPARTLTREELARLADKLGVRLELWQFQVAENTLQLSLLAVAEPTRWWRRWLNRWLPGAAR